MFRYEKRFSKRVPLALIFQFLLSTTSGAYASSGPSPYDRGMKAFSSGDYKNSDALFSQSMKADPSNANAMYMDALSLQQLGARDRAIVLYKTIMDRFPDSGAGERAAQALQQSDPKYVARWKAAHPPRPQFGLGPLTGPGLSPDFAYGTIPLSANQQREQTDLLLSCRPIKAKIQGVWTLIQLNPKQPYSYLGNDFLTDAGLMVDEKRNFIQTVVNVDKVRLSQFSFHKKARTTIPIVVGRDFQEEYLKQVAMADPVTGQRFLASRAPKREAPGKGKSGNGTLDAPRPGEEYFEVHYTSDNDGRKIIPVQVNGVTVEMIYGETSGMLMGPDQLRQIDPGLMPDLKSEVVVPNSTIRNSGTVIFRSVAVGKVVKYQVPCSIEAYQGLRSVAGGGGSPRAYPLLGSDFFNPWECKIDEQKSLFRVSRMITPAQPIQQQTQNQNQSNNPNN